MFYIYGGPRAEGQKRVSTIRNEIGLGERTFPERRECEFYDEKKNAAARCQPKNLRHEAFVQRGWSFLAKDS